MDTLIKNCYNCNDDNRTNYQLLFILFNGVILMEKKIDRNRQYRTIIILALILSIVTLSIAFILVNQTFSIDRIKNLKGTSWDISFDNLSSPSLVGSATIDTPAVLKNNSTIITFEISLKQLNDSITYYFDIVNNGELNAKINNINMLGVPSRTENLTWSLTYADGRDLTLGDHLDAGDSKRIKLTIKATNIPTDDITLNLGATIEYEQY